MLIVHLVHAWFMVHDGFTSEIFRIRFTHCLTPIEDLEQWISVEIYCLHLIICDLF